MTTNQKNKLNMYGEVINFCDDEIAVINSIPPLVPIYDAFKAIVADILNAAEKQTEDIRGFAILKKSREESLIELTLIICRELVAYSVVINDPVLEQKINFSLFELSHLPDIELYNSAREVQTYGTAALADIGFPNDFGLEQAQLDAQLVAINDYHDIITDPRNAIVVRHVYTQQIKQLFKDADANLKKIDKLLAILHTSNPSFTARYKSAREIIDLGHHEISLSGKILDSATHGPIEGVTVELLEENTKIITAATGGYRFKSLPAGNYTLRISMNRYKTQLILNIPVHEGIMYTRNIMLERGENRYEILPESHLIVWNGDTDSNLIVEVHNISSQTCQIWAYATEHAADPMPPDKIIINPGEHHAFTVADFAPAPQIYIHLYNPDLSITAQYNLNFQSSLIT